jgi:hypothetical protein
MAMMSELDALMKCPYDWFEITGHPFEDSILQADWQYALGKIGFEDTDLPFTDWERQLLEGEEGEINYLVELLKIRCCETKRFYNSNCAGRLRNLHFMTPAEQGRHYIQGLDKNEAIRFTNKNKKESLFFENVSSSELKQEFWDWVMRYCGSPWDHPSYVSMMEPDADLDEQGDSNQDLVLWRRLLNTSHIRICMKLNRPIGASAGVVTNLICYDIHVDTNIVHCFPVTEADAKKILGDAGGFDYDELNQPL